MRIEQGARTKPRLTKNADSRVMDVAFLWAKNETAKNLGTTNLLESNGEMTGGMENAARRQQYGNPRMMTLPSCEVATHEVALGTLSRDFECCSLGRRQPLGRRRT